MSLTMSFTGPVQGLGAPLVIGDPITAPGGSIDVPPSLTLVNNVPISAPVQIKTTVGALALNQLTTTQINAIVTPYNGMLTYNSTTNLLNAYVNSAWSAVPSTGGIYENYATGTLTAANINSMFTTGISLIPAPGAGFAIIIKSFVLELVGTATSFAAGGVVYLNYGTTGAGTTLASQIMPVTAITAASSTNTVCSATGLISNTVTPSSEGVQLVSTSVANKAIAITNATQLFTTGTGTANWYIWYSIIPIS